MTATLLFIFQVLDEETSDTQSGNWLTQFVFGEATGFDWLLLLGGLLFLAFVIYGIYSTMLYNIVGQNRHPANFRKLLIALWLLLAIAWFWYVFLEVFGGVMLAILFAVWLVFVLIFIFTRRKPAPSQA